MSAYEFFVKRSPAFPKKPGFCAAIMFENT